MTTNTEELIEWFEDNFTCYYGPQRAYFEFPVSANAPGLFRYQSFAVKLQGQREAAEQRLCLALRKDFEPLLHLPIVRILFWRNFRPAPIQFEQQEVQLYGRLIATHEQEMDGAAIPAGAVRKFDTNNWHEDGGKIVESKLYTRLVIPALNWYDYSFAWHKSEGEVIKDLV